MFFSSVLALHITQLFQSLGYETFKSQVSHSTNAIIPIDFFLDLSYLQNLRIKNYQEGDWINETELAKGKGWHHYWFDSFFEHHNYFCGTNLAAKVIQDLCRHALGGQMAKNVRWLELDLSGFELDQSQRKSSQVDASGRPNETQVERKSETCVASPFGQIFTGRKRPKSAVFQFHKFRRKYCSCTCTCLSKFEGVSSTWFNYCNYGIFLVCLFIYLFVRSFVCLCLEMLEYSEERHTWETVEDKLDQIRWVPNTFE